MNVIDNILNEWSFRCHDGVVDLNDSKKVKILLEILKPVLEDLDDDILNALINADTDTKSQVLKFIKKSSSKTAEKTGEGGFYTYLDKHNLTPEYIGSLSENIFEILSDNDDLDKFNEYRKSPKILSSLPQTGNIISTLSDTNVSSESINQLLNLIGTEGGRGIGKGEILLALFFGDTKISEGKGDLTSSSEGAVEIKGSGARLGDRGTNTSIFSNSDLAKLAIDFEFETVGKGIRIDTLISYLAEETDNNQVYKASLDFLKNVFPSIDITQFFVLDTIKSDADIRNALRKIYLLNYFTKEGIDKMMYINTSRNAGQFVFFTSDEITEIVNSNLLRIGNFFDYNMNPQLG
jgi:hypothetical protein